MGFRMSGFSNNSLYDRVNHLLESFELSDCSFLVCGTKIKAHKLILGTSSPVFEAMFYGPLSSNETIAITDVDPNIFQILLKFIYTDKVSITSIEDAFDLMYASRKYMLENLTDVCATYLITNLSIDNVITVLNYPDYMQDKHVVSAALSLFCQHAEYILTEQKPCIMSACMQRVVKSLELNMSERDLIKHVFEWTTHYCDQNEIVNTFKNRREALEKNGLLKYLRFYSLSSKDIEEIMNCKDNLLFSYEIEDIKQFDKNTLNIDHKLLSLLDNQLLPRKPVKVLWTICHRTPIKSEPPIVINQNNLVVDVKLMSNMSIFISSLNVPSRMTPVTDYLTSVSNIYCEQFKVSISCEADNSIIKTIHFKKNVEYDSQIDVKFDEEILLKKNLSYKISFIWQNTYCLHKYAVQKRDGCYSSGSIKLFFEDLFKSTYDGGCFLRGLKYSL